jgi:hypothetical protein
VTADPLAGYEALCRGDHLGTDIARDLRRVAAQLDAGRAACKALAAAGHGPGGSCHAWRCGGCRALRDAEVAGLWTPEPERELKL